MLYPNGFSPLFRRGYCLTMGVFLLLANSLWASGPHSSGGIRSISAENPQLKQKVIIEAPAELRNQLQARILESANAVGPLESTVIVSEGFEGSFPTGLWSVPTDPGTGCNWTRVNVSADVGSWSGSPIGGIPACSGLPGVSYPENMQNWLIYGPFSLSGATSAELKFRAAYELEPNSDYLWWGASGDCSSFSLSGVTAGDFSWQSLTYPLDGWLDEESVCIAILIQSDGVGTSDRGVLVDEIVVDASTDVPTSDLSLETIDVPDGAYVQGGPIRIFTDIHNLGDETSNSSSVDYYVSSDTTITSGDTYLGRCSGLDAINAGESFQFNCVSTVPNGLSDGSYYIGGILSVVDADDSNHVNHDATAILISDKPEIRVRPLSVDFFEQAGPDESNEAALEQALVSPGKYTDIVMPSLLHRADRRGFVRVIVGLEAGFAPEGRLDAPGRSRQRQDIANAGGRLIAAMKGQNARVRHRYETIPYLAMRVDRHALEALQRSPLVRSIEEDTLDKPLMASSNPVIGSPLAWAEGYDGFGWAVAVLDTGVDTAHHWFTNGGSRIVSEACYSTNQSGVSTSWCPGEVESSTAVGSGVDCDSSVDGCDHGTHVAGTIAGHSASGPDYGVARGADIIAMQVFTKFLTQDDCDEDPIPCTRSTGSDQVAALERVLVLSGSMDVAAVNMSLGGGQYFDQATCDAANSAKKTAIANLRSVNIATVIASGNDGFTDSIGAPGCISNAISVGATDDQDNVASFSNVYPQLHLLAPGMSIDSSVPGGGVRRKQGTSMATPHVAGAWAVMKQRMPLASVTEVLTALTNTATMLSDQRVAASTQPEGASQLFPRINLDMALGEPRTTFGIFNDGPGILNVASILPATSAPWVSVTPAPPYIISAGESQVVSVLVDFDLAPEGVSQVRLLVNSDDPDEDPFPSGVFVNVTTLGAPAPEFDSSPAAGSTINLGLVEVGKTSTEKTIRVDNLGSADLTLSCGNSGSHAAEYSINACPTPITPAGNANITIDCQPGATGLRTATLQVTTNDTDESSVSYTLHCTGTESPGEGEIFKDGFEGQGG